MRSRHLVRAMVSVVMAVVVLIGSASVAGAHASLDSSSPAASTVLETSPSQIRLTFNEPVESTLAEIRLFAADEKQVLISPAVRSSTTPTVVTAEVPTLDDGVYVVVWRVMSSDGHPATGAFPFEVGRVTSGEGTELVSQVLSSLEESSPLGAPLNIARFVALFSLMVLVGAVVSGWGNALATATSTRWLWGIATVGLFVGTLAMLLLQGGYVTGRSWEAVGDASLLADVLETRMGVASLVRFVAVAVWGLLFLFMHKAASAIWQNTAAVLSALSVATFSISGHAGAGDNPWIFVVVDVIHYGAIGAWVGGLVVMFVARREPSVYVRRFSRIATRALPVVVITGVVQAANHLDGAGEILSTDYGRILLAKVVIVAVLVLAGAAARQRIIDGSITPIVSILRFDVVLVVAVMALTSVLVGTPPGPGGNPADRTFSSTQIQGDVLLDLTVVPAVVGAAEVHVILAPPGGALAPVTDATVQFSLPERDIPAVPVSMIELGPNHWTGIVQFPYPGSWRINVQVENEPGSIIAYSAEVDVVAGR